MKSVTGYWLPTRAFSSDIFGTFASRSSNLAEKRMDEMNSTTSGTSYTSEKYINSEVFNKLADTWNILMSLSDRYLTLYMRFHIL